MTSEVFNSIASHNMIAKGDTVGVGLSGGADSVALTHFLFVNRERLGIKELKAVHVHHGIRGEEADRDLKFAEEFCEKLGIELLTFKFDVPSEALKTGESVEECARRIRYACFEKAGCDKFATAHNLNDNAETFFFNLSRGTSINGLCGIPYVRDSYIRPLLDCTREKIERYISENGLAFVTDSTNLSDDYTRNKIRHNILPLFFELNPSFDRSFAKCLMSLYDSREYILEKSKELYEKADCGDYLDCSVFKNEPEALRFELISMLLKSGGVKNISREHILQTDNIILNGGSADLPGKITVTAERNHLIFGVPHKMENFSENVDIDGGTISLPAGNYNIYTVVKKDLQNLNKEVLDNLIDCDRITGNLVIRNRREGDSIRLAGRKVTKTLKKLFNEAKIPASGRSGIAVLSDSKGLIWIDGFGVSERCRVTSATKKCLKIEKAGE